MTKKEYSRFTYSMGVNGDTLTIRSDSFDDIKEQVSLVQEFILRTSLDKTNKNDIALISADKEKPLPDGIERIDRCKKCGSEKLVFQHGISNKTGKEWYAFKCMEPDCKEMNWVNKDISNIVF